MAAEIFYDFYETGLGCLVASFPFGKSQLPRERLMDIDIAARNKRMGGKMFARD